MKNNDNNMKKIWMGVGAFVLVLLAAIVWYDGSRVAGNANILKEAVNNLTMADSAHAKVLLEINLPKQMRNRKRPLTQIKAEVDGDLKKVGAVNLEMVGSLDLEARGPGNAFFTNGELVILEDAAAFRLNEFPILLNPSQSLSNKWTFTRSRLLAINEDGQVFSDMAEFGDVFSYEGEENAGDETLLRFNGVLTEDMEKQIAEKWAMSNSGSPGLDVIARLLAANNISRLDVWVDKDSRQLKKIEADFVRPLQDGREFDFARLKIDLSDYGKEVTVDRPEEELTVRPEVFTKMFGTGEVGTIRVDD